MAWRDSVLLLDAQSTPETQNLQGKELGLGWSLTRNNSWAELLLDLTMMRVVMVILFSLTSLYSSLTRAEPVGSCQILLLFLHWMSAHTISNAWGWCQLSFAWHSDREVMTHGSIWSCIPWGRMFLPYLMHQGLDAVDQIAGNGDVQLTPLQYLQP